MWTLICSVRFWCIYYVCDPIGMQCPPVFALLLQIYGRPNLISAFKDMTFHPQIMIIIINHTGWVHTTDWNTGCVNVAADLCRKHDFIIYPVFEMNTFFCCCFKLFFIRCDTVANECSFVCEWDIYIRSFIQLKSRGVWRKKRSLVIW